jgi:hypothetical protein
MMASVLFGIAGRHGGVSRLGARSHPGPDDAALSAIALALVIVGRDDVNNVVAGSTISRADASTTPVPTVTPALEAPGTRVGDPLVEQALVEATPEVFPAAGDAAPARPGRRAEDRAAAPSSGARTKSRLCQGLDRTRSTRQRDHDPAAWPIADARKSSPELGALGRYGA